jgi:hypothetical protein
MQRYRIAFFITLAAAILLAAGVILLWLDPQVLKARFSSVVSRAPSSPEAARSETTTSEPALVPVSLTPQRMQSIGVKTGTVEYGQVHDEILTTGSVEVDETRLAEVQVRFAGWIQKVYVDSTSSLCKKGSRF